MKAPVATVTLVSCQRPRSRLRANLNVGMTRATACIPLHLRPDVHRFRGGPTTV